MTIRSIRYRRGPAAFAPYGWRRLAAAAAAAAALFFACLLAASPGAFAQGLLTGPSEAKPAAVPADPYGRETPRSLVANLVSAFADGDAEKIARYLEVPVGRRITAADSGVSLAQRLQRRLDGNGSLLPVAGLSSEPVGDTDDGLPLDEERIGSYRAESGELPLKARRMTPTGAAPYWVVSDDSVRAIVAADPATARVAVTERLPEPLRDTRVAGAPLADWLTLVALAAAAFVGMRLLFVLLLRLLRAVVADPDTHGGYQFAQAAFQPLGLYLAVVALWFGTQQLQMAVVARQALARYATIVGWVALVWFLWRLIDMAADLGAARMRHADRRRALSALVFVRRTAKAVLGMFAFVAVLDTVGIDVTTGIAALGLGGLALALGAQKTIENLVGSLTVILDQPVRVGDFCKVGEVLGTVEDIGMRSTRVRTNARTVVTIPNGNFASQQIENYSRRDRFLFHPVIGLTYDASAARMRSVLDALRKLLAEDDNVVEGPRVRFVGFNTSSLDIEIFAYLRTYDFDTSLEMQEDLLLRIMETIDQQGASIAFPTQTLLVKAP